MGIDAFLKVRDGTIWLGRLYNYTEYGETTVDRPDISNLKLDIYKCLLMENYENLDGLLDDLVQAGERNLLHFILKENNCKLIKG